MLVLVLIFIFPGYPSVKITLITRNREVIFHSNFWLDLVIELFAGCTRPFWLQAIVNLQVNYWVKCPKMIPMFDLSFKHVSKLTQSPHCKRKGGLKKIEIHSSCIRKGGEKDWDCDTIFTVQIKKKRSFQFLSSSFNQGHCIRTIHCRQYNTL